MMRGLIILFIVLTVIVIISGCIKTPATVAKETPGVLTNISNEISAMETPNITLRSVLQPVPVPADYIKTIVNVS